MFRCLGEENRKQLRSFELMSDRIKPTVLVVDDDREIAALVVETARAAGFKVRAAANAAAFLDLYKETHPTAIVMDIVMPGVDGIELLDRLANLKCDIPIILVSGYGGKYLNITQDMASAQGLKIAGRLIKPFDIKELEKLLQNLNTGSRY